MIVIPATTTTNDIGEPIKSPSFDFPAERTSVVFDGATDSYIVYNGDEPAE